MLKLADIKFPITFESRGIGHYIFTDEKTCHKVDMNSDKLSPSTIEIEHFIDAHNTHYNALKDYGYAMPGYTSLHYKPYKGQVLPVRSPERAEIPMVEMKTCDYKKLWCLNVDNIKYPITFRATGDSTITYTSRDNGVYSDGQKSELKVDFFVNGHNRFNPHNEKDKVYYVEDIAKHIFSIPDYWKINKDGDAIKNNGKAIHELVDELKTAIANETQARVESINELRDQFKQSLADRCKTVRVEKGEVVTIGRIESMPLASKLKGVQLDDGTWYELTATPKTIEIHDDVVILLLHYGGAKNRTVAGEISIKRGTMVKWKVKV
ncbi:hypothetical protein [Escherichia phage BEBK14]|nr:hypothetical protein [Escherichia phage BEBK14]